MTKISNSIGPVQKSEDAIVNETQMEKILRRLEFLELNSQRLLSFIDDIFGRLELLELNNQRLSKYTDCLAGTAGKDGADGADNLYVCP